MARSRPTVGSSRRAGTRARSVAAATGLTVGVVLTGGCGQASSGSPAVLRPPAHVLATPTADTLSPTRTGSPETPSAARSRVPSASSSAVTADPSAAPDPSSSPGSPASSLGSLSATPQSGSPAALPSSPPDVPPGRGGPPVAAGTDPFAGRQIVAWYGAPGTSGLGVLGAGTPAAAFAGLDAQARGFDRPGHPAARVFELIATVASDSPGSSGLYRNRLGAAAIEPYLQAVRAGGGTLVLDVQPGRSDFLDEVEALEPWLVQPDVGLALDPEWRMGPRQVPGREFGSVDADEVNAVSSWLEDLTVAHHLPDKLFVLHQFTRSELRDEDDLADHAHLHEILNVDGFGSIPEKVSVYDGLARESPYPLGLKLFYHQDTTLMTPAQVLALRPRPQLVDYQ